MNIVVADDLPASALDILRAEGWNVDARTGRSPEQLATDLADADAIVVRSATKVTGTLIAAAPKLRVIARAGTGVDNVDVTAATDRGIVVMNAPGANSVSVGEIGGELFRRTARAGIDGPSFRAENVERGGGQVVSNYDVQERTDEGRSALTELIVERAMNEASIILDWRS